MIAVSESFVVRLGEKYIAAKRFLSQGQPLGLIICIPGGSYTHRYYDLEVPGYGIEEYSCARYLANRGFLVVAIDTLGTGESFQPSDGGKLTGEEVAEVHHQFVKVICLQIREGTFLNSLPPMPNLPVFGMGHSLGAYELIVQQACHQTFDGTAILGWSNGKLVGGGCDERVASRLGLPDAATTTIFEFISQDFIPDPDGYLTIDRQKARPVFYLDDVPEDVIAADEAHATWAASGLAVSMTDREQLLQYAKRISVPIFLGTGEIDIPRNFREEALTYSASSDISIFELAGSAHCHNFSTNRLQLWQHLAAWLVSVQQVSTLKALNNLDPQQHPASEQYVSYKRRNA